MAIALGIALATTPVMARVAVRLGFLDRPAGHKAHGQPHPLLGGVAIYLGILGALLLGARHHEEFWLLIAAATLLVVAGLFDDRFGLSVAAKLLAQGVAAAIVVPGSQPMATATGIGSECVPAQSLWSWAPPRWRSQRMMARVLSSTCMR